MLDKLHELGILLEIESCDGRVELLLFYAGLVKQLIARLCLLNHHFHHHLHLVFRGLWASHAAIFEHLVHTFHLDLLLGLEGFDGLLLGEGLHVVGVGGLGLLLHLHYLHAFALILSVEHGGSLELLLADAQFLENLIEFVLNEHLFFLDHHAYDLFVELLISVFESLSALSDKFLSPLCKMSLAIKRAHLENLQELIEIDISALVKLQLSEFLEIFV